MNIAPVYTLEQWRAWWHRYTDVPVIFAQDTRRETVEAFELISLGTKVLIDSNGHIVYRSAGVAGYNTLSAAVREAL